MTNRAARIWGGVLLAFGLTWIASTTGSTPGSTDQPATGACNADGFQHSWGRINLGTTLYYRPGGRDYVPSGVVARIVADYAFDDGTRGSAVMVTLSDGLEVPRKRSVVTGDDWFVRCP